MLLLPNKEQLLSRSDIWQILQSLEVFKSSRGKEGTHYKVSEATKEALGEQIGLRELRQIKKVDWRSQAWTNKLLACCPDNSKISGDEVFWANILQVLDYDPSGRGLFDHLAGKTRGLWKNLDLYHARHGLLGLVVGEELLIWPN